MIIAITKNRTDRTSPLRVSTVKRLEDVGEGPFVTISSQIVESTPPPPIHISVSRNLRGKSNLQSTLRQQNKDQSTAISPTDSIITDSPLAKQDTDPLILTNRTHEGPQILDQETLACSSQKTNRTITYPIQIGALYGPMYSYNSSIQNQQKLQTSQPKKHRVRDIMNAIHNDTILKQQISTKGSARPRLDLIGQPKMAKEKKQQLNIRTQNLTFRSMLPFNKFLNTARGSTAQSSLDFSPDNDQAAFIEKSSDQNRQKNSFRQKIRSEVNTQSSVRQQTLPPSVKGLGTQFALPQSFRYERPKFWKPSSKTAQQSQLSQGANQIVLPIGTNVHLKRVIPDQQKPSADIQTSIHKAVLKLRGADRINVSKDKHLANQESFEQDINYTSGADFGFSKITETSQTPKNLRCKAISVRRKLTYTHKCGRLRMTSEYMNRVYRGSMLDQTKQPTDFWQVRDTSELPRLHGGQPLFDKFEEAQLQQLSYVNRKEHQYVDETGKIISKEQDLINKTVRNMMIKVGLIDDDNKKAEDDLKYLSVPVNLENPYKKTPRTYVKYYERPEKIRARVQNFTNKLSQKLTRDGAEIDKLMQHMLEDEYIEETFISEREDDASECDNSTKEEIKNSPTDKDCAQSKDMQPQTHETNRQTQISPLTNKRYSQRFSRTSSTR